MARDPQRLLEQPSVINEHEQRLLESLRGIDPPADAAARGWQSLAQNIAIVGAAATLGSASSNSHAASSLGDVATTGAASGVRKIAVAGSKWWGLKLLSGVVLAGAATTGVFWSVKQIPTPTTSATSPSGAPLAPPPDVDPAPSDTPSVPIAVSSIAVKNITSAQRAAVKPVTSSDLLTKESELVMAARAALRQGDVKGAGTTLQELDRAVPHGKLAQEREVLRIEWLAAQGDQNSAARRARAFLAAHPKSPHAARLTRFVD